MLGGKYLGSKDKLKENGQIQTTFHHNMVATEGRLISKKTRAADTDMDRNFTI